MNVPECEWRTAPDGNEKATQEVGTGSDFAEPASQKVQKRCECCERTCTCCWNPVRAKRDSHPHASQPRNVPFYSVMESADANASDLYWYNGRHGVDVKRMDEQYAQISGPRHRYFWHTRPNKNRTAS